MIRAFLLRFAAVLVTAGALPTTAAMAQVEFGLNPAGSHVTFDDQGNLLLEGQCFANLPALPAGVRVTMANGRAAILNGNLYLRGQLIENATVFPGATVFRDGGTTLGSMNYSGFMYLRGTCQNVAGCSNTTWEPSLWNDGGSVQLGNNCYNYGNDKVTNTFAQPGRASGQMAASMTVSEVRAAALRDGLRWVGWNFPGNTYDCGDGHLVYMAIWPNTDYHWWRLDHTRGLWSHKPGQTPARTTDNSGLSITNPLVADRGPYTDSGGFYCTCGGQANVY